MRRMLIALAAPVISSMIGCANCTSNETDPSKISTCQMLVGKSKLDQHLQERRAYLSDLNARLETLDDDLLAAQATLFKVKNNLDRVALPERELTKLRADIEAMEREQSELAHQIFTSQEEIENLRAEVEGSGEMNEQADARLKIEMERVARMERKLDLVQDGVKRAVAISMRD